MDEESFSRRNFVRAAGGAAALGAAGTAGAQEGEGGEGGGGGSRPIAWPDYVEDARVGSTEDLRGQSSVTVEVGAGPEGLAFVPTRIHIDPGTTVTFEWVSGGHNVLPNSQPDGEGWEGSGETLQSEGFTYEHTFETGGMYSYFCSPHEGSGMKGAIAVGENVPRVAAGSSQPVLPDEAMTLVIATMGAMGTTLALAYFFLRYGGNPPRDAEAQ